MGNALSKPLRRSIGDRFVAGVCGGIAKWLGWDPTLVRVLYVVATFFSLGFSVLAYIVLWIVMPEEGY